MDNNQTSSQINLKSSQMFFNIADEDMKDFFMEFIEEDFEKENAASEIEDDFQNLSQVAEDHEEKTEKNLITRLEIEIEKNKLPFVPVYGEIFIMLFDSELIGGEKKKEKGILLVTNYRVAFFNKQRKKRVDVPFGFVERIKFLDKHHQIDIHLKHTFLWKFQAFHLKDFNQFKIFKELYVKASNIKSTFAFNYGMKCPQSKKIFFSPQTQFSRLKILQNEHFTTIQNKGFGICQTYPEIFFIPVFFKEDKVKKVSKGWISNRFPIISYLYKSIQKVEAYLWRSSNLLQDKHSLTNLEAMYLKGMHQEGTKLIIFDADSRQSQRYVQQSDIYQKCKIYHLEHESLETVRTSYDGMVNSFLYTKKQFIHSILQTKWYDYILHLLQSASRIANTLLNEESVLLKCQNGFDRSAQLSALAQIIIDPYYRTMEGFAVLVQKEFNYFSYPFSQRLGIKSEEDEQIPLFIQFLDCVSQLIHTNQMSFQFNYKFLSKLSNFMYTMLFGTFICDSRKEIIKNNVETETVPIWPQLNSELTKNAFYQQKQGVLKVTSSFSEIRLWKQHFWYLTTAIKDSYKIHPLAQGNDDYVNIECRKVMQENESLRAEINHQRQTIQKLREEIEKRKGNDK